MIAQNRGPSVMPARPTHAWISSTGHRLVALARGSTTSSGWLPSWLVWSGGSAAPAQPVGVFAEVLDPGGRKFAAPQGGPEADHHQGTVAGAAQAGLGVTGFFTSAAACGLVAAEAAMMPAFLRRHRSRSWSVVRVIGDLAGLGVDEHAVDDPEARFGDRGCHRWCGHGTGGGFDVFDVDV